MWADKTTSNILVKSRISMQQKCTENTAQSMFGKEKLWLFVTVGAGGVTGLVLQYLALVEMKL